MHNKSPNMKCSLSIVIALIQQNNNIRPNKNPQTENMLQIKKNKTMLYKKI